MTTTKREFIPKLEDAWAEISKLDAELAKRTGKPARSREDVESIINIDTANEEIARLDAQIAALETKPRPTPKVEAPSSRIPERRPATQILRRNFVQPAAESTPATNRITTGLYGIQRALAAAANSKKK